MEDWASIYDTIREELRTCREENEDLKQKLAAAEKELERAAAKVQVMQGHYADGYRLAEKAVMGIIMDVSSKYGPVDLTVSARDENGDTRKRIVLRTCPDGVLRELVEWDLVKEVSLSWDGVEISTIPERLDEMFGV